MRIERFTGSAVTVAPYPRRGYRRKPPRRRRRAALSADAQREPLPCNKIRASGRAATRAPTPIWPERAVFAVCRRRRGPTYVEGLPCIRDDQPPGARPNDSGAFPTLQPLGVVVERVPIETRRLDDIDEIVHLDLLKIAIQGGELAVLRHGRMKLAETVAIQTKVSFVTWHQSQPPFGEVDSALRSQGFIPHCFTELRRSPIGNVPVGGTRPPPNQLTDADAVYVRDFAQPDVMTDEQLKHLALIAHHCYGSIDLTLRCVVLLEQRQVIAQEWNGDALLFRPGFLRERIVAADSENRRAQTTVSRDVHAHAAHFCRAGAGEGHREKKQERVPFAEIFAERDWFRAVRGFGRKCEIRCFAADGKCHEGLGLRKIHYRNEPRVVKRLAA